MADRTYLYQGPVTTVITLPPPSGGKAPDEKLLHPGKTYSLPEDHERVRTLSAKGYLVERPAAQEPVKPVKAKEVASGS